MLGNFCFFLSFELGIGGVQSESRCKSLLFIWVRSVVSFTNAAIGIVGNKKISLLEASDLCKRLFFFFFGSPHSALPPGADRLHQGGD